MPFKSKAQWRACFAADDPNWDCREWADSTPSYKELPKKKKKEKKADDSSDLTPKRVRVAMPHEDGYLMEKLKNPKFPANIGRIRFPGGGIDAGETPETAAVRELKEELGIDINSEDLARLGVYPDGVKGPEQYFQLDKHTLAPGNYKATVGGDKDIELITGKTDDKNYWGGQLNALKQANIDALLEAKKESDRKNYGAKHDILRKLISQNPDNFIIDSAKGNISGITHTPTGFQIHMPSDTIPSGVALKQAAEKKPEDDVYVQSAVPSNALDMIRKHGLLSSQALMNNPESLKAFLANREGTEWDEDEETFKKRITEKLKDSFFSDSARGPSVLFGDPDPEKITDAHPSRKLKTEPIRVNLSKLLQDQPKTRISGSELQPYDPEGPEHQGDLRHYDIDLNKVREYAATDPKELWKHYNDPEGVRYAGNVPHAQIVTPSGSIAPEYLDFGDQATAPGTEDITQSTVSVKSASTMLGHFLVEQFKQRVTGTESVFFKENAHMPVTAPATEASGLPGFDTTERDKLKAQAQAFVPKKQPMIPQNAAASAPASNVSPSEVAPGFGLGRYAGGTPALGHSLSNSQLGNGAGVQMPKVAAAITGLLSGSPRI